MHKGVVRNLTKFTGKHLCQSFFLLKKRLWHRCFPVSLVKCLRMPFLQNISGRLLLFFIGTKLTCSELRYVSTKGRAQVLGNQVCLFVFLLKMYSKIFSLDSKDDFSRFILNIPIISFLFLKEFFTWCWPVVGFVAKFRLINVFRGNRVELIPLHFKERLETP